MMTRREVLRDMITAGSIFFLPPHNRIYANSGSYISGDKQKGASERQQYRVVIGQEGSNADFCGNTEKVIQAGIDSVARYGGGIVQILQGIYRFSNAVYLTSHIKLIGSGSSTIFVKEPSIETEFTEDADWYEQCITVKHPEQFKVGDGLCIRTKNPHHGGMDVIKRTIIAIEDDKLILDKALRDNVWLGQETTIATLFPLISGEFVEDIVIENLVLDGNKENNLFLDGNYAGCIWLQDCNEVTIRNVEARNYNGDGISWQIVHDVVVDNCFSHDNTGLGLHPGSGSQRPKVTNNRIENNDIGIFFCWGVQNGIAENNRLENNRIGISIGHRDNDNQIQKNKIVNSVDYGILFREESERFTATGNKIRENVIENLKSDKGVGISIEGLTKGNEIQDNMIRERNSQGDKIGIKIGKLAKENILKNNKIVGFKRDVVIE
ncbi:MAG TPA: right-handed parallel beta-helix repeat-containing protein [Candidatus Hydrogenedens sp.]|nr:right-handed parallel beta-helix repeat-containing protein [Candidatus Hydrogenedens sp.]HOK09232.1 right-handed parallel beta-helix repeat-containing protein [Candidatus Hydrogenedens sp.]